MSIITSPHHATKVRRLRALTELCRLVRPGGKLLVYAWAIEQEQDSRRSVVVLATLIADLAHTESSL